MTKIPDLPCSKCGKLMWRKKTSATEGVAKCRECRKIDRIHGTYGRYLDGCRCDACKSANARHNLDHVRKYRAKKIEERGPIVYPDCTYCGTPTLAAPQTDNPMHKECGKKYRDSIPQYMKDGTAGPAQKKALRLIEKAANGTSGKRVFTAGSCEWCGEYFVGIGKFCGRKCMIGAKHARNSQTSFNISPTVRLSIYERDSWTCQLCSLPVDGGLHFRDNFAPSLDHIVPRSTMLIPDHSPSNLRLVHRICNSMRGDGSNMSHEEAVRRVYEMLAA